jgi:hypothetical protein
MLITGLKIDAHQLINFISLLGKNIMTFIIITCQVMKGLYFWSQVVYLCPVSLAGRYG